MGRWAKSARNPAVTIENELRRALAKAGFHTAAKDLRYRELPDPAKALASWANYPACMARFPEVLKKKRTWVDKRGA